MKQTSFAIAVAAALKPTPSAFGRRRDVAFKATRNSIQDRSVARIYAFMRGESATKAQDVRVELAFKAESVDTQKGIIIAKLSKADVFDRENERIPLDVLERATYELVRKIGMKSVSVNINHRSDVIQCEVLQAWIGEPMPDPKATYVTLRPTDRAVFDSIKSAGVRGMSWEGPYSLRPAA